MASIRLRCPECKDTYIFKASTNINNFFCLHDTDTGLVKHKCEWLPVGGTKSEADDIIEKLGAVCHHYKNRPGQRLYLEQMASVFLDLPVYTELLSARYEDLLDENQCLKALMIGDCH